MLDAIFSWTTLWRILVCLYVPACLGLIVVVLLQKGKGSSFAGAFGIGAGSDTVFGPRAGKSLPVRLTYVMAGTFLVMALAMSLIAGKVTKGAAPDLVDTEAALEESMEGFEERGIGTASEEGKDAEAPVTVEVEGEQSDSEPAAENADQHTTEAPSEEGGEAKPGSGE